LRSTAAYAGPSSHSGDDFEKEACFAIGLLAIKQPHQQRIADAGALPGLVSLLKRLPAPHLIPSPGSTAGGVARRAADAITNLAHENVNIKAKVRSEGGIAPLVALLESHDSKVQRAAAGALRTLAFKNEENKNLIVECGALPHLIYMVRDPDVDVHYEAIGVLGNLVHSSTNIKKRVLEEGALQPVIGLLSSTCTESQREAALLLGQFATTEADYKVRIVQRGAVAPLIAMLCREDAQLREMAAFALGRLAQNADNQAGICHSGGLRPLLDLLDDKNGSLQHNAAFALYGLADNEDNVAEMVKEGTVQRLLDADLVLQASKDCVSKTLKRLEDKTMGRPLQYLLYVLRPAVRAGPSERDMQRRVAVALAHLCRKEDASTIFRDRGGLDVLLEMLAVMRPYPPLSKSLLTEKGQLELVEGVSRDASAQREAARALLVLATDKCTESVLDVAPAAPGPPELKLPESYVNNSTSSDVTFVVEGADFYAHRIALQASSDTFRAMFEGGYKERDKATKIEIPNIPRDVFDAMMRCIYTGKVEVTPDIAQELLRAADQYLLEGLKRLCETAIAEGLTIDNLMPVYDLAETYHAQALGHACVLYALKHYAEFVAQHDTPQQGVLAFTQAILRMMPTARSYFEVALRPKPVVVEDAAMAEAEAA
jgi:HEAT repeat protein